MSVHWVCGEFYFEFLQMPLRVQWSALLAQDFGLCSMSGTLHKNFDISTAQIFNSYFYRFSNADGHCRAHLDLLALQIMLGRG
jgi:hypothetical protein